MVSVISLLLLATALLGVAAGSPTPAQKLPPHLNRLRLQVPPPPVHLKDARAPVELWLEQELDHFHPTDTTTWRQKYYLNDQYYTPGGPMFIFIGGEGPASPAWLQGGQMMEIAQQQGATTLELEHRFYGDSRPTLDTSAESLQYLTTEQALADVALLIMRMRQTNYPTGKVVVFGGSYAGNLAAWARLKYPHLIDAAVASSAPVLAQVDFPEYYEVVATAMYNSSSTCLDNIREASDEVTRIMYSAGGEESLTQMFNLCTPLDINNHLDVSNFYSSFAGVYAGVVQYATNVETVGPWCELMTNPVYGDTPLDRYVYLANRYIAGGFCMSISYQSYIDYYGGSSWDSDASQAGMRQWIYQTCTEYGYYQTSSSPVQPFGDFFDVEYYLNFCTDAYDASYTPSFVYKAAERTNMIFGGKTPKVDKVVFVHGSIDPWHVLGVLQDLSADAPVVMIKDSAHCADMSTSSSSDSAELTAAKAQIAQLVDKWLVE